MDGEVILGYKIIYLSVIDSPKEVMNSLSSQNPLPAMAVGSYKFTRTLKSSTKGDDVKILQQGLMKLNYLPATFKAGVVFDTETRNAVKKFQLDNKIKADGIFGSSAQKIFSAKLK
jgi:peptidoglycan hydrolase-like protein with peptidoglycan-binding domain